MIVAYTGLAGSGKTYHMTSIALSLIQRGEIVFSRHELEGAYPLVDEREMLRMNDCHVFFDEWHQDHGAKEWWNLDEVLKHMVTQSRKYSIVIHWSAQHWLYMDSFIRRNTDYCWEHRALFRDADTGASKIGLHKAVKISGIDVELKRRQPEILAKKWIWIKPKVYQQYDSFKPIMISKTKLSDDEINAIADPYSRDKIHITEDQKKGKSHAALSANPTKDSGTDFVSEQDRLDCDRETEHSEKLTHGQKGSDDLDTRIEISHPVEDGSGQWSSQGQQAQHSACEETDQADEKTSNHI
jgi:hypothetical protein